MILTYNTIHDRHICHANDTNAQSNPFYVFPLLYTDIYFCILHTHVISRNYHIKSNCRNISMQHRRLRWTNFFKKENYNYKCSIKMQLLLHSYIISSKLKRFSKQSLCKRTYFCKFTDFFLQRSKNLQNKTNEMNFKLSKCIDFCKITYFF